MKCDNVLRCQIFVILVIGGNWLVSYGYIAAMECDNVLRCQIFVILVIGGNWLVSYCYIAAMEWDNVLRCQNFVILVIGGIWLVSYCYMEEAGLRGALFWKKNRKFDFLRQKLPSLVLYNGGGSERCIFLKNVWKFDFLDKSCLLWSFITEEGLRGEIFWKKIENLIFLTKVAASGPLYRAVGCFIFC
jgi:hypothetical protein